MGKSVPFAVLLLLLLPALAMAVGPAGGQIIPELTFTKLGDTPVDSNNNNLYDKLVIQVDMDLTQAGTYSVVCDLSVDASGTTLPIDTVFINEMLDEGINTVYLEFPSEAIYRRGVSGVFRADIEVQKIDYYYPWKVVHLTGFYDYRTFEAKENPPPVPPDAPIVELDLEYINVTTDMFQVFVNRTSPEVIFRYSEVREELPDFVLVYSHLVLFEDDGNGYYNGEEVTVSVMLSNHPWAVDNIDVSGPQVSFDLKARVPIPLDEGFASATMTLTFTVTNGTVSDPHRSAFIRGDNAELKVDIGIELDVPIPDADHIAIVSRAWDTMGTHDFLVEEPVGFILYPRREETGFLPVPRVPVQLFSQVGLVDENLVWHAFVGWMNLAQETWAGSDSTVNVDVGGSFRVIAGHLELVTAYPYTENLVRLEHDPSAGVVAENLPPVPPEPLPPEDPTPNVYLFVFALVVGAVILMLTVYARAQGY